MKLVSTIYAFLGLMRPIEWSKSLGNMVLAVLTAAIIFPAIELNLVLFVQGFASVALLWSGLYTLNDYTDWKQDKLHPIKKIRAIPSGRISPKVALFFSFFLIIISLILAFSLNTLIVIAWFVMLINQLLYTLKPFSFKKRPVLDLISGSLVNPIFRFYYGWLLFVPAFDAPIAVILFMLGFQFGGYGLYRLMSLDHDKKTGTKSSVGYFGAKTMRRVFCLSFLVGSLAYFIAAITVWKFGHLVLGFIMLLFLPLYWKAIRSPDVNEMNKLYWLVYATYLVFIVGFIGVFLYF